MFSKNRFERAGRHRDVFKNRFGGMGVEKKWRKGKQKEGKDALKENGCCGGHLHGWVKKDGVKVRQSQCNEFIHSKIGWEVLNVMFTLLQFGCTQKAMRALAAELTGKASC